jgi:hypothetical protein
MSFGTRQETDGHKLPNLNPQHGHQVQMLAVEPQLSESPSKTYTSDYIVFYFH